MTKIDLSKVASVTVTYHPDPGLLRAQLDALPSESRKILVDNGSSEELWLELADHLAGIENLEVLRTGENLGLAAATNIGAQHVGRTGGARWLLLLDQDSVPRAYAIERLLDAYVSLTADGVAVGAVGPALLDPATGRRHGFHQINGLRWRRVDPAGGQPVRCDSLNGSGTLVDYALFERLGGLDAKLFIDHVDTEWSFRLAAEGWQMYGIPEAEFVHRMGDHSVRIWMGSWRVWPIRSPPRHRYLFRNAVLLWKRPYTPLIWKVWVVPKLLITAMVFVSAGPARRKQLAAMVRGLMDGMHGRGGPA